MIIPKELASYLKHTNCIDCPLAKWDCCAWYCPLLQKWFEDDGKVRTTKRMDCPIKKLRDKAIRGNRAKEWEVI